MADRRRRQDPFTASFEFRRKYISDRVWFGLGLGVISIAILLNANGWARLFALPVALLGAAWALRRKEEVEKTGLR